MKPRSLMMYGASGSTKTSQCFHLVKYLHGTKASPGPMFGKKWRLIHSDGGGYAPFVDSGLVQAGVVEIFDFSSWPYSLSGWRWLQRGYWPRDLGKGMQFSSSPEFMTTPEEWNGIAGYIHEGIASEGETLKTHVSNQKEKVGFKNSYVYEENGEEFRGLDEGHYGLIQKEIFSGHMKGFNTLPIPWLVYTSLVGMGKDKQRNVGGVDTTYVYGPQIVGNAATPSAPQWFMDCLHLSKEKFKKHNPDHTLGEEMEGMVAWFTQHNDSVTGMPYLCKCRLLPELYPELLRYFPYGFVPLGFNHGIDNYFRVLDSLMKKAGVSEWL